MPYSDPSIIQNPADGLTVSSSMLDQVIANQNYTADTHPRCRAYNNANVPLSSGSYTAITLNSERYDSGGCHSTSVNTQRMTVPTGEAGLYSMGVCAEITASAATIIAGRLLLNGATMIAVQGPGSTGNSTSALRLCFGTEYELAAGDYVEAQIFVNAGSLNALYFANYSPEVWFRWVATIA